MVFIWSDGRWAGLDFDVMITGTIGTLPKMLGTPNCQVLRRTGCAMCHKARLAVPLLNLVCVQTTAASSDTSLVSRLPTASLIQGKPP